MLWNAINGGAHDRVHAVLPHAHPTTRTRCSEDWARSLPAGKREPRRRLTLDIASIAGKLSLNGCQSSGDTSLHQFYLSRRKFVPSASNPVILESCSTARARVPP